MSTEAFNHLTLAQDELLSLLAEECAEVIQIVMKIQRHGLYSCHPDAPKSSNKELLEKELGDVESAKELLRRIHVVNLEEVQEHKQWKLNNVGRWLHHYVTEESEQNDDIPF